MASDLGGFLRGAKFKNDRDKDAQFAVVWGFLTRDPTVQTWGDKVKTSFLLKTYTDTFQLCVVWGQGEEAIKAGALTKGDEVVVVGRIVTSFYRNKKGEDKTAYDMNIFKIFLPSAADVFLLRMMQSQTINHILDKDEAGQEDAFESEADFMQEAPSNVDENGDEFMEIPDDLETPFM